jgi:putative transposase
MSKLATGFKSLRNCVYSAKYHIIFCPKYRRSVLSQPVAERFASIAQFEASGLGCEILEMEVMPDHVHILVEIPPPVGIHKFVKQVKGVSAGILRSEFPELKKRLPCLWTNSYFCSTIGGAPLEIVKQYIENQKNV